VLNVGSDDLGVLVEVELDELSETGRVVVTGGLGVTEGLEQRVGGKNTRLEVSDGTTTTIGVSQVAENVLGGLSLSGSRLSRHNDTLGKAQVAHVTVGLVGCEKVSGEEKRRERSAPMA
jgi:hypothetical protein